MFPFTSHFYFTLFTITLYFSYVSFSLGSPLLLNLSQLLFCYLFSTTPFTNLSQLYSNSLPHLSYWQTQLPITVFVAAFILFFNTGSNSCKLPMTHELYNFCTVWRLFLAKLCLVCNTNDLFAISFAYSALCWHNCNIICLLSTLLTHHVAISL